MQSSDGVDDVRANCMIGAVVIAAGTSHRMGSPKALLRIGGTTFLQRIVDTLRSAGIGEIVVVLGADTDTIRQTMGWFDGKVVLNENWREGQLTSIIGGLNALSVDGLDAALVCPVDHPLISNRLITSLVEGFRSSNKGIVLPVYRGRRGHPVLFAFRLFDELRNADPSVGARQIVRSHEWEVREVETDEEGIVANIDTPQDYQVMVAKHSVK